MGQKYTNAIMCEEYSLNNSSINPKFAKSSNRTVTIKETHFKRIAYNSNHVLYQLLPQPSTTVHNLCLRRHDRTLPDKQTRLYICIMAIYYKNIV